MVKRTLYEEVELTYNVLRWNMGTQEKTSVIQPRVLNTYSRSMYTAEKYDWLDSKLHQSQDVIW